MSATGTLSTTTTTKKEKNEEQFELEQQFILRMPPVVFALNSISFFSFAQKNVFISSG